MLKLISILLLSLLCSQVSSQVKYTDIQLSLDFHQINLLKNSILRPLVEQYIKNFTIKGPIDLNLSLIINIATFQLSNIRLTSLALDWDKTILAPVNETHISLTLFDLDINLETDYDINFMQLDSQGRANVTITNLTVFLELYFSNNTIDSGFSMGISNFTINYDSIQMNVDSKIISLLFVKVFKVFKCVVIKQIVNLVLSDLNSQIIGLTSQMIQIPVTPSLLLNSLNLSNIAIPQGDTYILNISVIRAPAVVYFQNDTNSYSYLTLNLDVQSFNNRTKEKAKIHEYDLLPVRTVFSSDIQTYICNSFLIQLQWIIIDSGLLNITIDDSLVPDGSPVRLNTSSIMLLMPGMTAKYGQKKGIYVRATAASSYSKIVFRGGRLVGEITLLLEFFVDMDSSKYPIEGLDGCMSCERALSLNTTLLLALHAYNKNETSIFANIITVDFYYMSVLDKTIDFDVNSFQVLMKNVARSFIPILNTNLKDIPNPITGMFGVKSMQFKFSLDSLFLGFEFD